MTNASSAPYERYAEIYDRIGQRQFGQRLVEAILADDRFDFSDVKRVADLACGTGAAALRFAAAGFEVVGVDRSEPMLKRAAESANQAKLNIQWLRQDLRELMLPVKVDLSVCFYDSLNYILGETDLSVVFQGVAGSLKPSGTFVFDLNSIQRFASNWADATMVAADEDDLYVVYRSTWDVATRRSPLTLTVFTREHNGAAWERFDETHVEQGYPTGDVVRLLKKAGFINVQILEYHPWSGSIGGSASEQSDRMLFVAELGS